MKNRALHESLENLALKSSSVVGIAFAGLPVAAFSRFRVAKGMPWGGVQGRKREMGLSEGGRSPPPGSG